MELIVCHQPRTGLQGRMAFQGTSKVESVNVEINRLAAWTASANSRRSFVSPTFGSPSCIVSNRSNAAGFGGIRVRRPSGFRNGRLSRSGAFRLAFRRGVASP